MRLPTGTVTFMFTDIHDSTRLWERGPEGQMREAMTQHDALLRACAENHGGTVVKSTGDGLMVVFGDASSAVAAAIEGQRAIENHAWTLPIGVRMGLHSGTAEPVHDDYHAPAVNRAARVAGAAHAGQILVSAATAGLADQFTYRYLGEHRLKGLPAMGLLQVVAEGLRDTFPALASSDASTRLPTSLTSFVGRHSEIEEVCRLFDEHRLVTFTGVGGCGKTRLAIEVASRIVGRYADGVRFVDLAPISDPDRVLDGIVAALGLVDDAQAGRFERVVAYVTARALLVVLDNCEHVLDATAEFVEAVTTKEGFSRILATSREPLAVTGEQVYTVRSLAVETDAVRLFADRAALLRRGFALDVPTRAAVVEVCRRLDGIPLAIELAAAQIAHLSVAQILERLNDRFRLLVGGRRRVPRQQTLAATLDWSHDMLLESERFALRRLAVFPASFSLEAAQAVVGTPDVLSCLASLVSKSLVDVLDEGERFRYRLLETVRMYAEQRLVEAGEANLCRERHRDWVVSWIESTPLAERWFGDHPPQARELASIRAALEYSASGDDLLVLARIASGFDWTRSEHWLEGVSWCERAAQGGELPAKIRHQLYTMLAVLKTIELKGGGWAARAVATSDGSPNPYVAVSLAWQSANQAVRAVAAHDMPLADEARATADRAIAMSDEFPAPWRVYCRFVGGMAYGVLATSVPDDLATAEEHFRTAAALPLGTSYSALRATTFEYLALFRLLAGDSDEALSVAEHAPSGQGHWPMFGPHRSAARMLALAATGQLATAHEELRRHHETFQRNYGLRNRDTICMYAGAIAAIAGDWERAALLLAAGRNGIYAGAEAGLVYYHYRDRVRLALGAERARQLRSRGMEMSLDDATTLALGGWCLS